MSEETTEPAERLTALVVTLVGLLLFVALAATLVPWDPAPGGPRTVRPATDLFSAAEITRAEEYSRWARVWSWSSLALTLALMTWVGFSRRGRRVAARLPGPWWVQVVLAVAALSVLVRLVTLPLGAAGQIHRRRNGLSAQGWVGYASDVLTSLALSVVVTSLVLLVVVGTARRWARAWPAAAGAVLGALVLLGSFAYPVLVEPLFNSFESLPAGDLRTEVLALADAEGVPVEDVLVADASRRTTTLNAYVSGFGGTRRIVLYDNLVEDLPQEQALSVVAHELAHARHSDVVVGSVLGVAGAFVAAGLLGLVLATGRARQAFGSRRAATLPAAVPLLMAMISLGGFLASPVENTISRQIETRADVDALAVAGDDAAFVAVQRQLSLRSLSDPTPPRWSQFWFGSHPTTLERLALARSARRPSAPRSAPHAAREVSAGPGTQAR